MGQSSSVSGYTSGGLGPVGTTNTIDKFPFASNANATDVGDCTGGSHNGAGQSSTVSGYNSGMLTTGQGPTNTIEKFPYATDSNASDVGDMTTTVNYVAGQQV
jgi:hypothetical protein